MSSGSTCRARRSRPIWARPTAAPTAVAEVTEAGEGVLDGLITCAGISGFPGRPASLLAAVNYFGTVEVMEGLRPALAAGTAPSAVAISSNSTTTAPGYDLAMVDACLAGDEAAALEVADRSDSIIAYAATKLAVARWVRRSAVSADWAGAGIRLNAIAPGMIATPMIDEGNSDENLAKQLAMFEQTIALGRPGRAEEMAALLAFLVGPESTFFCGSIVFCDGGTDAAAADRRLAGALGDRLKGRSARGIVGPVRRDGTLVRSRVHPDRRRTSAAEWPGLECGRFAGRGVA